MKKGISIFLVALAALLLATGCNPEPEQNQYDTPEAIKKLANEANECINCLWPTFNSDGTMDGDAQEEVKINQYVCLTSIYKTDSGEYKYELIIQDNNQTENYYMSKDDKDYPNDKLSIYNDKNYTLNDKAITTETESDKEAIRAKFRNLKNPDDYRQLRLYNDDCSFEICLMQPAAPAKNSEPLTVTLKYPSKNIEHSFIFTLKDSSMTWKTYDTQINNYQEALQQLEDAKTDDEKNSALADLEEVTKETISYTNMEVDGEVIDTGMAGLDITVKKSFLTITGMAIGAVTGK